MIALEPEEHLRGLADRVARTAAVPIRVVGGVAQALPLPDGSLDAVVASLVLCSVPSQRQVLGEMHRVLRPGGQLRFYEHVLDERRGFARFQRAADVAWPLFAGGCHTSRDTLGAISDAGFHLEGLRRFGFRPSIVALPATPHVLGVARRS